MDAEPGTIVGDKYRLEGPLSRGGMGSVWLARHLQLGAPAAIKFMDPEHAASPEFRARFYREARTAANLGSPHVVSVQDYGIWGAVPYLVMELLRGEDLSRRLRRVRRLSLAEAARIAIQTGKALRRAHESGLVHRDLKPGNLFLSRVDEDEEIVKILDFGIAKQLTGKLLTDETTRTGELLGSPFYMSPEQARGDRNLDARSDLWSLGVILFRAVTGKLPFEGDVLGAVLSRILCEPIPLATHLAPDVPADLDVFFLRALSRDRAQRFQSAQEMVHAFVVAMGDPGIPLPVPSAPAPAPVTLRPAPVTSRTGTLLGLSPGGTGDLEGSGELAPLSRPGDQGPRPRQDTLASLADPSRPGTLTAAAAGEVRVDRRPHASATLRWLVACGALSAISATVAVTALRPVGEEGAAPYHVAAPIEPESVSSAAPTLQVVRASTPVMARLPLAEDVPAADAALLAATAEPAVSAERKAPPSPSAPRRSPRRSREIIDPWQRR
ncbi:serine/threonine-protein kinase [Sorangium sp. So ce327]|uniref:serine/threonine-protein kinase n=1 Tax=Sorangium sp. So ce327 TaxID=3133301 RepID=UPI003F607B6C